MSMLDVGVEDAVFVLNKLLKVDPVAINQLVCSRVICNKDMADYPDVQVGTRKEGGYRLGILGILNAIFGTNPDTGYGYICANFNNETGLIEEFSITEG